MISASAETTRSRKSARARTYLEGCFLTLALVSAAVAEPVRTVDLLPDAQALLNIGGEGKAYSLAITTGPETPAIGERSYGIEVVSATGDAPYIGTNRLSGHDDHIRLSNGIGTQIDGLAHVGVDGVHFDGVPASEIFSGNGVKRYGLQDIGPVVTRGVLLDVAALRDTGTLAPGYAITEGDIEAAMERQGIAIKRGDVVLIHTGWLADKGEEAGEYLGATPGLARSAAKHLAEAGIWAVGADNWSVEVVPAEVEGEIFPLHQLFLARHGVYLLENIWTADLAADKAWEFLFVLGVPRLQGSVQAVINPIAIR